MQNLFEYYTEDTFFHLKYAKGRPAVTGQEFHDYNEFVWFLNGSAKFISANIQQNLAKGCIVMIPKEHFHQFCIEHPEQYTRCILGFRDLPELKSIICEVMDTVKIITNPNHKILSAFENLTEVAKSTLSVEEKKLFIRSAITQLLICLKFTGYEAISQNQTLSPVVVGALDIIESDYSTNLSAENIAKKLHTSNSTLAHKFSKELNIPIYRYITKKRLSEAHKRIESGETHASAALNCGFSDYSCFYRLYKKYYK